MSLETVPMQLVLMAAMEFGVDAAAAAVNLEHQAKMKLELDRAIYLRGMYAGSQRSNIMADIRRAIVQACEENHLASIFQTLEEHTLSDPPAADPFSKPWDSHQEPDLTR